MKILGTGLQGLVGSRVVELLSSTYQFENISRTTGIDISNKEQVSKAVEQSDADIVLHLAAKANVDKCEEDKQYGEEGEAWKINVEGTRNIVQVCETFGKKLIYISTDFVFNGEKDFYVETDAPDPLNWYAQTKYEGEKVVQKMKAPWIIARIAYPYRAHFSKIDFVRAVKNRLEDAQEVRMVTDHIMSPTYIDDIAHAFTALFQKNIEGIYHVVGSQFVSPYAAAGYIADTFELEKKYIMKTTRAEFFQDRALRPFRLALKNDKIKELNVTMSTFEHGIQEIKKQLSNAKE